MLSHYNVCTFVMLINTSYKTKHNIQTFKIMKTITIKASAVIFLSAALFGFISCENKSEHSENMEHKHESKTEEVAKEQNDAKFTESDDEKNAKFLVKATEINMEEISLGKLAQQKSTNTDVKELGKMMEKAHTKGLADVRALALKKGISVPTGDTEDVQNTYTKFSDKDQKEFNKDYADQMVDGHKKAIELFEKESKESSDADIREWASSMLPELRTHLDHAIAVQDKLK